MAGVFALVAGMCLVGARRQARYASLTQRLCVSE